MAGPVIHLDDVPLRDWGHGDRFAARLGRVGGLIGAQALGCQLHEVPPGKTAFPRHAHHANEEMIIVLAGEGTYEAGGETYPVRAGSVCAAPAGGAETAHQLLNTGTDVLRYLCVSTRNDPDIVEYPDSGKMMVSSLVPEGQGLMQGRIFHITRPTDPGREGLDYWDGED